MKRLLMGASLVLALFTPIVTDTTTVSSVQTTPSIQSPRRIPGCPKTYTVAMDVRAARAIYRGTRHVTLANLRYLGRLEHCQRNSHARPYVRWFNHHQAALHRQRVYDAQFTGYVVSGGTSTFGPPTEGSSGTADGGDMNRPCIALQDPSTLGRMFLVTIDGYGHSAKMPHCDSGPYAGGRAIDVTGDGSYAMGINPFDYPTDAHGTARELR